MVNFGMTEALTSALAEPAEELRQTLRGIWAEQKATNDLLESLIAVETAKLTATQQRTMDRLVRQYPDGSSTEIDANGITQRRADGTVASHIGEEVDS